MERASSILYQNDSKTVLLLDLPRSIEEGQLLPNQADDVKARHRYLVSALPPDSPFPTPEPKNKTYGTTQSAGSSSSALIADLMTQAAVETALEVIRESHDGPWCLPRQLSPVPSDPKTPEPEPEQDSKLSQKTTDTKDLDLSNYLIPKDSHPIPGTISSQRATFLSTAPSTFDLIIMDPPWPNRSAKRKRGPGIYQPAPDVHSIKDTLSLIPVASHLRPGGLVAVWVTNSSRSVDLLTARGGMFDEWQVELVGEWTWLKVTSNGEPIVDVHSAWRKPWERLLIARKRDGLRKLEPVRGKVIVTVPDLHSRKPNLRFVFEELLPRGYRGLEVFARNLTAGWWCWGDQVLLFQHLDHWVEAQSGTAAQETGP